MDTPEMLVPAVGRTMPPWMCACPTPWSPGIGHITWQRGTKGADGMKAVHQLILTYKAYPAPSEGSQHNCKGPSTWRRDDGRVVAVGEGWGLPAAAVEEEGSPGQGKQTVSRSWKRQGSAFSPRASKKNAALRTP